MSVKAVALSCLDIMEASLRGKPSAAAADAAPASRYGGFKSCYPRAPALISQTRAYMLFA